MEISTIADVCGIVGFLISIYAAYGVIKIKQNININKVNMKNGKVKGDFTGRDRTN